MESKHNIVYRITNRLNGKVYVGVHKTNDIEDYYMGSGKIIKKAIEKYGLENFNKEILFDFPTYQEALNKEKEVVDEKYLARKDVYNIKLGGTGGFDYINKNSLQNTVNNDNKRRQRIPKMVECYKKKYSESEEFRDRMKEAGNKGRRRIKELYPNGIWYGKKHSEETKKKMSLSKKGKKTTSTLGKHWFTDGTNNIIAFNQPEGYHKGRV